MMGLPLDDLSIARGMAISNINDNYYLNLTLGIIMHLLTGAIAGVIFAVIVSTVKKLAIINFKRGIRRRHLLDNHFHSFVHVYHFRYGSTQSI